jgi:hypothetical protein
MLIETGHTHTHTHTHNTHNTHNTHTHTHTHICTSVCISNIHMLYTNKLMGKTK